MKGPCACRGIATYLLDNIPKVVDEIWRKELTRHPGCDDLLRLVLHHTMCSRSLVRGTVENFKAVEYRSHVLAMAGQSSTCRIPEETASLM
jgi:hypothetical protein